METAAAGRRRSSRLATDDRLRVSTEEMKELMEYRGAEAVKALHELYGGTEKLCGMLGTSPTEGSIDAAALAYFVKVNVK